jgi:hypothetical protein
MFFVVINSNLLFAGVRGLRLGITATKMRLKIRAMGKRMKNQPKIRKTTQ